MNAIPKVTFVLDQFAVPSPAQQLLDRFLIGYNRDGTFYSLGCEVTLACEQLERGPALASRTKDFGLKISNSIEDTLGGTELAVLSTGSLARPNGSLHQRALRALPSNSRCFVHGFPALSAEAATELVQMARSKNVALAAGTATAQAFRLPQVEIPRQTRMRKALVVGAGPSPKSGAEVLSALLTLIEDRAGASNEPPKVQKLAGVEVWSAAYSNDWQPLLASAISRSNTIQGNPQKDGRTQEIVSSHILEKLVPEPHAWLLEHADGLRSALFILAGALQDINFALELGDRSLRSAQLYRPPAPQQAHYSRLTQEIETFFRADRLPDRSAQLILAAGTMGELMK